MAIHSLKAVIGLIPDVVEHIKQAKVEQEFPTDCKDSVLASALEIVYLTKIAHQKISETDINRVSKAVSLYKLQDEVASYSDQMTKSASSVEKEIDYQEEIKQAEYLFEGNLSGLFDLEKTASQAESLWDSYSDYITSPEIEIYSGAGYLNKQAAIESLHARALVSKNPKFTKLASIINATKDKDFTVEDNRMISKAVLDLEKSANIYGIGFNFYKEAFLTKAASVSVLQVKLAGKSVPVESILRTGMDKISHYLGSDIAQEMGNDPQQIKAVAESLPLDSQKVLATILS